MKHLILGVLIGIFICSLATCIVHLQTVSANPIDVPEVLPLGNSISVYEDEFARCYIPRFDHGFSCIPKPKK